MVFSNSNLQWSVAKIYVDNILTASANSTTIYQPLDLNRSTNYKGKNVQAGDRYSFSYLDDLKFYNICLEPSQINDEIIEVFTTRATISSTSTGTSTKTIATTFLGKMI